MLYIIHMHLNLNLNRRCSYKAVATWLRGVPPPCFRTRFTFDAMPYLRIPSIQSANTQTKRGWWCSLTLDLYILRIRHEN